MRHTSDPREKNWQPASNNDNNEKSVQETQQEQTDPNLTELKGLTDSDEKLEPEGTDNDFSDTL
ncbi:MAG TPA: hypothetical protein VD794_02240 [Flavisolibacter sp.]|nr:hypothetical protein [Flavisolibacter sp.]